VRLRESPEFAADATNQGAADSLAGFGHRQTTIEQRVVVGRKVRVRVVKGGVLGGGREGVLEPMVVHCGGDLCGWSTGLVRAARQCRELLLVAAFQACLAPVSKLPGARP
jgi:hypothetical protein